MVKLFYRFSLTETDHLGGLPSDLSLEEGLELKLQADQNKTLAKTKPKKPKTTKPKKSLAPSKKSSKTPKRGL